MFNLEGVNAVEAAGDLAIGCRPGRLVVCQVEGPYSAGRRCDWLNRPFACDVELLT